MTPSSVDFLRMIWYSEVQRQRKIEVHYTSLETSQWVQFNKTARHNSMKDQTHRNHASRVLFWDAEKQDQQGTENSPADFTAWEFQQSFSQYRTVLLINLQYLYGKYANKTAFPAPLNLNKIQLTHKLLLIDFKSFMDYAGEVIRISETDGAHTAVADNVLWGSFSLNLIRE